jgi:hypothetical protein
MGRVKRAPGIPLQPKFSSDVVLCTDGHITPVVLNQNLGERVKEKVFHIQTVNAYHMRLKQWLASFHDVATNNLHKYAGWFRWF